MAEETKNNNPVIRISIAGTVGDKCQISMETYVDAAMPTDAVNLIVDKLMFVRDRQTAYYEVQDLKKLYATETNQLDALKEDLKRVDAMHADKSKAEASKGMRVPRGLSEKQMSERNNIVVNIQHRTIRLEQMQKDIASREILIGERSGK